MAISIFTGAGLSSLEPILIPMLLVGIGALILVLLNIFRSKKPKQVLKRNKYLFSIAIILILVGSLSLTTVEKGGRTSLPINKPLNDIGANNTGFIRRPTPYPAIQPGTYKPGDYEEAAEGREIQFLCGSTWECEVKNGNLHLTQPFNSDIYVGCNKEKCIIGMDTGISKIKEELEINIDGFGIKQG